MPMPNAFAADARHVAFDQLPDSGIPAQKIVNGSFLDREEYDVCEWRVDGQGYWRASLAGLQRWGQLREQRKQERKSAWQARVDRDDEYSDSITALIDKETK